MFSAILSMTKLLITLSCRFSKILHIHVPIVYLSNTCPCYSICKPSLHVTINFMESITEFFTHAQQCGPGAPSDFHAPGNKAKLQATLACKSRPFAAQSYFDYRCMVSKWVRPTNSGKQPCNWEVAVQLTFALMEACTCISHLLLILGIGAMFLCLYLHIAALRTNKSKIFTQHACSQVFQRVCVNQDVVMRNA